MHFVMKFNQSYILLQYCNSELQTTIIFKLIQMQQNKSETEIDRDSDGVPEMTLHTIQALCRKDLLPQEPQLNDKLYLMSKGFTKIGPLSQFHNLVSLWLNDNLIERVQNLTGLSSLVCLYLNNNKISKIQNLNQLQQLQILNLENNQIKIIEGLQNLLNLKNLNVASNLLTAIQSIQHIRVVKNLSSLDLSANEIQNTEQIYFLISSLPLISCLYLKTTPFARGFKNYQKKLISVLPRLKFLDDRPVLESDHRLCEAWLTGGAASEKQLRHIMQKQQVNKTYPQREMDQMQLLKPQDHKVIGKGTDVNRTEIKHQKTKQEEEGDKKFQEIKIIEIQVFNHNQGLQNESMKQYEKNEAQLKSINEIKQDDRNIEPQNWKGQYESILQALLEKYKFDFSQVQPQFNMIITNINKKLNRHSSRFQIWTLQKIWTGIQKRKRETTKI